MIPNRTKSGLFETARIKNTGLKSETGVLSRSSVSDSPRAKVTPTTPTAAKLGKPVTPKADPSPHLQVHLQNSRHSADHGSRSTASLDQSPRSSVDRSPRSVDSKLSAQQRTPRISNLSDRRPRVEKGSELQSELNAAQEQLKSATDRLKSLEDEKARALDELEVAKRQAEDANQRLAEALAAQKQAEETTEIEKFRIVELEQMAIEDTRNREEDWKEELERVRKQHEVDVSALHLTTHELQRLKQELAKTTEAKNAANCHAESATRVAEVNAAKAMKLSAEIGRLKGLLDSKVDIKEKETSEQIERLNSDIETLQGELERAKEYEVKLIQMEAEVQGLKIEVEHARKADCDARALLDEWKKKAGHLGAKLEEATRSEEFASGSLALATKKLEEYNSSLQLAESEISSLKRRVEVLEMEIARYKAAIEDSNTHLDAVKNEISESEKTIDALKCEIQNMEEDKNSAMGNADQMAANLPILLEEKKRLLIELEASRSDIERTKKAVEGLDSALHEVSSEVRYSQAQLQTEQLAFADARIQIEESKLALKSMEERYEAMLIEAKGEVERLVTAIGGIRKEAEDAKSERMSREGNYSGLIRKSEEEIAKIKEKMSKLASKLVETEVEAAAAKEDGTQLLNRLMQAKFDAASANETAEEARAEVVQLKERLLDKENELQNISQENEDLRAKQEASMKKIKELSMLLEEVKSDEANKCDSTADIESKTAEFPYIAAPKDEACIDKIEVCEGCLKDLAVVSSKPKQVEGGDGEGKEWNAEESMNWESCKVANAAAGLQHETVSLNGSFHLGTGKESFDCRDGGESPSSILPEKKKKNFLGKFKSLIKKKNSSR